MTAKQVRYWILLLGLSFLPTIAVPFLIKPMWFKGVDSFTRATEIQLVFSVIVLPIFLLVTHYILARNFKRYHSGFLLNVLIIVCCIFLSTHLHFSNWASSIGNSESADAETLGVMNLERSVGTGMSLLGCVLVYFRLRAEKKRQEE